tara:strand:+ start:196 stop:357 length:162 start_codon:yes stop_codon:yes gene_type:complete
MSIKEELNIYVKDYIKIYNGLPMDFEYKGFIYDFDFILDNLDDTNNKTLLSIE